MKYLDLIDNLVGLDDIGDLESIQDRLIAIDPEKLLDLSVELRDNLPSPTSQKSPYRFVGNTQMSALPYPCASYDCRSTSISNASLFAAMYADELVLFNPLSYGDYIVKGPVHFVSELSYYISNLIALHPLIERGFITFTDFTAYNICNSCFAKGLSGALDDKSSRDIFFLIASKFIRETKVVYSGKVNGAYTFTVSENTDYGGHPIGVFSGNELPKSIGRLKKNQVLDQNKILAIGIAEDPDRYLSNDIIQTNNTSSTYGIQNISTTNKQLQIMKEIFGQNSMSNSIEISYPFLAQRDIRNVLRVRDQEWHHLHDFRKMIDDGLKSGDDVGSLFRDEEAKIEKIVQKSKRTFRREMIDGGAKVAFNAVATAATGGISAVVAAVVAAFGGKHIVDSVVPTIRKRFEESEEVRESRIYYAWKLRGKVLTH